MSINFSSLYFLVQTTPLKAFIHDYSYLIYTTRGLFSGGAVSNIKYKEELTNPRHPVSVLLNGSLLYDYGCLSDCFVQNGRFLVAFLYERSFFVKIRKITKGGPLDNFATT